MDTINDDVRSATRVYLLLAVFGAAMLIVGWYEWLAR